jgi:uncharacterized protein (TIRG00374 family)
VVKGRGRLAVGFLVAAVLLFFFFRGVHWGEIRDAFARANPWLLAGTVFTTILTYLLRAWRWGYLLAPLATVPLRHLVSATFVGFMSGLLIPRAGEVVRPYLVARRHNTDTAAAFASIILERLVDLLTVLSLFGAYLWLLPLPVEQRGGAFLAGLKTAGAFAAAGAIAILVVLYAFHANAERALAWCSRVLGFLPASIAGTLNHLLASFAAGLGVLRAPLPHLLAILGQSALVWASICIGLYWNNLAFGVDLPFQSTFLMLGFLTVGVAVPTPGMVGGFHESYMLALTQAFGADKNTAVAAAVAAHALTNLPVLLIGLACLPGEGLTLGRVTEMAEEEGAASPGGGPSR